MYDHSNAWQCQKCLTWSTLTRERHTCYYNAEQTAFKEKYGIYPHEAKQVFESMVGQVTQGKPGKKKAVSKPAKKPRKARAVSPEEEWQARQDRNEIFDYAAGIIKKNTFRIVSGWLKDLPGGDDDE